MILKPLQVRLPLVLGAHTAVVMHYVMQPVVISCFKKSFASYPKAIHWHPTLNGDFIPRDICMAANKKAWFNCDIFSDPINIPSESCF